MGRPYVVDIINSYSYSKIFLIIFAFPYFDFALMNVYIMNTGIK